MAHSRVFIPQDKLLELCKCMFVVPEEVEFIKEDVFGVNDFKIDTNSKTPINIQDIKLDIFSNKGDLTSVTQFYPFPDIEDIKKWEEVLTNSENGIYSELPSCTLKQNRYVQKVHSNYLAKDCTISRRDVCWHTMNIKKEVPNVVETWKSQVGSMMEPWQFYEDIKKEYKIPIAWSKVRKGVAPSLPNNIVDSQNINVDKDQGIGAYE